MVAPNYAKQRSALAKKIGLGRDPARLWRLYIQLTEEVLYAVLTARAVRPVIGLAAFFQP